MRLPWLYPVVKVNFAYKKRLVVEKWGKTPIKRAFPDVGRLPMSLIGENLPIRRGCVGAIGEFCL